MKNDIFKLAVGTVLSCCSILASVGMIKPELYDAIPVSDIVSKTIETDIECETCVTENYDTVEDVSIDNISAPSVSDEEIELIALCCMGEGEGEPEIGKRLIIDVILNRVDSEYFPNTISEVIWQEGQFSCMTNGRLDDCYVMEDICVLVREELKKRIDYDVIFFRTEHYSTYGEPLYQVAAHYFSSYGEVE